MEGMSLLHASLNTLQSPSRFTKKNGVEESTMKTVGKLELLFSPGCGAIESTKTMVRKALRELDLAADVSEIMVDTEEKARKLKFLGSPSIRFNGRDIEPGAD